MTSRLGYRVTVITGAMMIVWLLAVAAFPTTTLADDDDDDRWEGKHRHKHGRRHGWWDKRPHVVHVTPSPVVIAPPVVVAPRVVVSTPVVVVLPRPAYVWVEGHYESRLETHYVPGSAVAFQAPPRFELRWVNGRFASIEVSPGHYEYRSGPLVAVTEAVQVWVPGRWVPADQVSYRGDRD